MYIVWIRIHNYVWHVHVYLGLGTNNTGVVSKIYWIYGPGDLQFFLFQTRNGLLTLKCRLRFYYWHNSQGLIAHIQAYETFYDITYLEYMYQCLSIHTY